MTVSIIFLFLTILSLSPFRRKDLLRINYQQKRKPTKLCCRLISSTLQTKVIYRFLIATMWLLLTGLYFFVLRKRMLYFFYLNFCLFVAKGIRNTFLWIIFIRTRGIRIHGQKDNHELLSWRWQKDSKWFTECDCFILLWCEIIEKLFSVVVFSKIIS